AVVAMFLGSVRPGAARPQCPSDGITRTTSGSVATGSTCDQATINLMWNQEAPKIDCPYGSTGLTLISNTCSWNGSAYQLTGWIQYQCLTDCYGTGGGDPA
ncbi:MAG TPA: hypothetical protein VGG20_22660, partial [Thermoanaerobaculia bacterium]